MKKFEVDIGTLISNEEAEEKIRMKKRAEEKDAELNKEAYVEGLNGSDLFNSLFKDDAEGDKLNQIPGADELLAEYHEKFQAVCKEMYEFGKEQKRLRQIEVEEFWKCLNDAKRANTDEATISINVFMEFKQKITEELNQNNMEAAVQEMKLEEFSVETNKLWDKLMSLEVIMVDQLEVSH